MCCPLPPSFPPCGHDWGDVASDPRERLLPRGEWGRNLRANRKRIGAGNVVGWKSLSPTLRLFHFLLYYGSVHTDPLKEENN